MAAAMMGEINVTPLVDVVLVLLLVFMVTAPMMSRGIDVSLPVADQPKNAPEDRVTVSVNAEGRVFVADKPVHMALLEETLRNLRRRAYGLGGLPARRRGAAVRTGHRRGGPHQEGRRRPDRLRLRPTPREGRAPMNDPIDRLIDERQRMEAGFPKGLACLGWRPRPRLRSRHRRSPPAPGRAAPSSGRRGSPFPCHPAVAAFLTLRASPRGRHATAAAPRSHAKRTQGRSTRRRCSSLRRKSRARGSPCPTPRHRRRQRRDQARSDHANDLR